MHGDYGGRNWRGKHFDERGPIPYGHLPPPGECRNWYDISAVPFVAASKRNANYCRVVALPFGGGWYWATPLARTQTLLSRLCCPFPGCVQVLCGASSNLFAFSGSPLSGFAVLPRSIWLISSFPVFSNLASSWPRLGFDFPARLCLEVDCCFVGMCASRSSFCSKKPTLELPFCCARGHDSCRPSEA